MLHFRLFGQAELHTDDGRSLSAILAQPKRFALLAYLAAARPSGLHRRDSLLALFWPELDQERGRAALRQALYTLRRALGDEAIVTRGDGEVGINSGMLSCDVVMFRDRLLTDPAGAAALYHGDLLNGFFITDAPEFERWLEEERWLLRRQAADAAWRVAERVRESDVDDAIRWAARAAALDPFNEEAVRRLMRLLASGGHRASALQMYNNFARLLERELDTAPSDETQALAALLRSAPAKNGNGGLHPELEMAALPVRARFQLPMLVAAVVAFLLIGLGVLRVVRAHGTAPVIAVGAISGDAALRDMIATGLARVDGVRVVSNTRLVELTRGDTSVQALSAAARRAGANRLLEGRAMRDSHGETELLLHWTDLRTGEVREAVAVRERNVFALVDATTSAIARAYSLHAPPVRFADVTTSSVDAYRRYEEGVRAYYHDEVETARRLLREAVRLDSTFAVAWWYLSRVVEYPDNVDYSARADRLAARATDRERLFIHASWLSAMDDPARIAPAETLAIRYPSEPDGVFLLAKAKQWAGDFNGSIALFERVVRMDSASLSRDDALRCKACEAMAEIGTSLALADSGHALVRFATDWAKAHPNSKDAWAQLCVGYEMTGRYDDAIAARNHSNRIPPVNDGDINNSETLIRAGRYREAAELLDGRYRFGDDDDKQNVAYKRVILYRNQHRYREALAAAREYRRLEPPGAGRIYSVNLEAYVLLDVGQPLAAAARFDSTARARFSAHSAARSAQAVSGGYARVAEAYAQAGDTMRVRMLIDSTYKYGQLTAFGPVRAIHHHVRGLLHEMRGEHELAVREFRAAIVSPTNGWTRTNLHLARELMKLGRYREAAEIAGSALRGSVGGGGFSVPHRDFHEVAAGAWRSAGVADSARVHKEWVRGAR